MNPRLLAAAGALLGALAAPAQTPTLVKDIATGPPDANIGYITATIGSVFFRANDTLSGNELWATIPGGITHQVVNIGPDPFGGDVREIARLEIGVVFAAFTPTTGSELWISDELRQNTKLVKDILPGSAGSLPRDFFAMGKKLYFSCYSGGKAREVWETDGTEQGTKSLGLPMLDPKNFEVLDSFFLCSAEDGFLGHELWKSDGTPGGTQMVMDIRPGIRGSGPARAHLLERHGAVLGPRRHPRPRAVDHPRDSGHDADGRRHLPGTEQLLPSWMEPFGGKVFLSVTGTQAEGGTELWTTDGFAAGTKRFMDINPGAPGSNPHLLTRVGSRAMYFSATDGNNGVELWKSDGTVAGTKMVVDMLPGRAGFAPGNEGEKHFAVNWAGVYFSGVMPGTTGEELYTLHNGATATQWGEGCDDPHPTLDATDPLLGAAMDVLSDADPGELTFTLLGVPPTGVASVSINIDCELFLEPSTMETLHIQLGGPGQFQIVIPSDPGLLDFQARLQNVKVTLPNTIVASNAVNLNVGR